jgi:hypothetical protein
VLPVPITVMAPEVKFVPFVQDKYPALRLWGLLVGIWKEVGSER